MTVIKKESSKTVRIYGPSIDAKWNAFVTHARMQYKQPGHLLGEIFNKYFTDNLEQITADCTRELEEADLAYKRNED
jgi:uncharacterized membrane protein|tara:strand:- start:901 stop:1131 length:231 start_codon:yes stop_codon:yes gene_type:complete